MPTGLGSATLGGNVPTTSARVVENLLQAGAVIMGKTTTCELAYTTPTTTTNPHNAGYSPGGSSAGSAAAVAARHVPIAIGSQTGGSVIRPASYCGTYGFKPSRGVTSRVGFFQTSATLDQVGVFTNDLRDAAMLSDVIGGLDQRDEASYDWPRPDMYAGVTSDAPVRPAFCWFDMPYHDQCDQDVLQAMEQIVDMLGVQVDRLPVAPELATLPAVHKIIYDYEIARKPGSVDCKWGGRTACRIDGRARGMQITKVQYPMHWMSNYLANVSLPSISWTRMRSCAVCDGHCPTAVHGDNGKCDQLFDLDAGGVALSYLAPILGRKRYAIWIAIDRRKARG